MQSDHVNLPVNSLLLGAENLWDGIQDLDVSLYFPAGILPAPGQCGEGRPWPRHASAECHHPAASSQHLPSCGHGLPCLPREAHGYLILALSAQGSGCALQGQVSGNPDVVQSGLQALCDSCGKGAHGVWLPSVLALIHLLRTPTLLRLDMALLAQPRGGRFCRYRVARHALAAGTLGGSQG